jgi:hypothetical protein
MSPTITANLICVLSIAGIIVLIAAPVHAFTANSLDVTINKNGDAVASFKFTLEGFLENAIPESMLEEELKKGLTTSSDPPVILSMDKSGTTMLMKKFADTREVEQGTEYQTATMNFEKAEIALKNSALNSVITADFSPAKITVTFPDGYAKTFENSAVLPSITHVVIDPSKPQPTQVSQKTGKINVTSSPSLVHISIDGSYAGDSPHTFIDIPAGTHTFLFQKDGFLPVTKTVTAVDGRTTNVFVFLQYTAQTTTAPQGLLPVPGFGLVLAGLALGCCVVVRRMNR